MNKIYPSDAAFLKGSAMLAIMLHNYFHILQHAPGENEFSFSIYTTHTFLYNLYHTPQDVFRQLFPFFGHYGVQLFVFLSGYGLAQKYAASTQINYKAFLFLRFRKLYPVLLLAVVFLFLYKAAVTFIFPAKEIDLAHFLYEAFLKLTLVSNLIPGEALSISGPWWFFSLIFQLYLVAPILLRIQNNRYLYAGMVIPWLIQFLLLTYEPDALAYVRVNLLGHLPEFCLGIYLDRTDLGKINARLALIALLVFTIGSYNQYAWVVSFFCVPLLAMAAYRYSQPALGSTFGKAITFFGNNSLYFFAVHGLCRAPFVAMGNKSVAWSILGAIGFLLVVTVLTMVFKQLVNAILLLFSMGWKGVTR